VLADFSKKVFAFPVGASDASLRSFLSRDDKKILLIQFTLLVSEVF